MAVLVVADHSDGILSDGTARTITAALELDATVDVLVAGEQAQAVAEQAAALSGVTRVRCCDDAAYAHRLAEPMAALILSLMNEYAVVMAPGSAQGRDVLPRVAAVLDVAQLSEITRVIDSSTFERPIYAGNVLATVVSEEAIKVITVRITAFEPTAAAGSSAPIEAVAAAEAPDLARFVEESVVRSDRPELGSAKVVISGGRGVGSAEGFKLLEKIADELNAAIGASRAAVDAGYVPNDYQVGQSGKAVAPDLYIAVGISGAIQHWAGMKDSKVVVAINVDEECPMVQTADYALVADLFDVLPELEEGLAQLKAH
ncbi:MAG: FAD-binding protein [Gammaproteobacteria bacterium]|nr:FAD-binding protein [Gammaproteobacteria bacterium]